MSEVDYEHECERAELLGVSRPSREEFFAKIQAQGVNESSDDVATEVAEDIDLQGEQINRGGGKLDELNSILSETQKKINRFKTVCGSFSSLIKLRIGVKEDGSDATSEASVQLGDENQTNDSETVNTTKTYSSDKSSMNTDVKQQIGSQIDKLDSLIMKADRAELSMHHQNKEMKRFLN